MKVNVEIKSYRALETTDVYVTGEMFLGLLPEPIGQISIEGKIGWFKKISVERIIKECFLSGGNIESAVRRLNSNGYIANLR